MVLFKEKIVLNRIVECSPAQYRWAFDDLRGLTATEAEAHHREFGSAEIASFVRVASPDRLLKIALQRLSSFPELPPSQYFHAAPGRDRLDVFFSHANIAEGYHAWRGVGAGTATQLFINTHQNDWYRNGVPDVTQSLIDTARWIEQACTFLKVSRVRLFGSSMGAYAAIAVGAELGADQVYAFDPELIVGRSHYRSARWAPDRHYPEEVRNIVGRCAELGRRLHLFQAAWDLQEARWIATALATGIVTRLIHAFHGASATVIDWPTFFTTDSAGDWLPRQAIVEANDSVEAFRALHKAYLFRRYGNLPRARDILESVHSTLPLHGLHYFGSLVRQALGDTVSADQKMSDWRATVSTLRFKVAVPEARDVLHEYFSFLV